MSRSLRTGTHYSMPVVERQVAILRVCPQMLLESYLTAGRVAWVMIGFPQPKHQTQETRNGV